MKNEELLGEVEDILRSAPARAAFGRGEDSTLAWIGRAAAAIERWDGIKGPTVWMAVENAQSINMDVNGKGFSALKTLLWQARADLRMQVGQLSRAVAEGQVFEYFDELRKIVESARSELFFVDPYLDAEFVSRYLPHVTSGVSVRLLGRKKMATLLPAVDLFGQQASVMIQVRSSESLHDRYVFVDRRVCHLSGASFKDGGRNAPAIVAQVVDGCGALLDTYERIWNSARSERR